MNMTPNERDQYIAEYLDPNDTVGQYTTGAAFAIDIINTWPEDDDTPLPVTLDDLADYWGRQHTAAPVCDVTHFAGEIKRVHHNRQTGTEIVVWDGLAQKLDLVGGRWYTECVEHHTLVNHPTRRLAIWQAAAPLGWCEGCQRRHDEQDSGSSEELK